MSETAANLPALIKCARTLASRLGLPPPLDDDVARIVDQVLSQHEVFESVRTGLVTKDEAALLVMAHLHSDVFLLARSPSGERPWDDDSLLTAVKIGLFG
jgi:hypothetical protein